jgi:putative membrane protein insertion efficiency factor
MRALPEKHKLVYSIIFFFHLLTINPSMGSAEILKQEGTQSGRTSESAPFIFPIQIFRDFISGFDGDRCPMHPSCSRYAIDAVRKHGSVMGWIMTCDRLLRCGLDETRHTPPVRVGQRILSKDPVDNNDFWRE